ncbi:MAG: hypothetical protein HY315_00065 [Acidobacteria bacterium]|nr:hypothetical protein [Acidobacteriota bacterium]
MIEYSRNLRSALPTSRLTLFLIAGLISLIADSAPFSCVKVRAQAAAESATPPAKRAPLRVIRDRYSALSSVAVDLERNEVVGTDENLFQIVVYERLADTPRTAAMTEPKRVIGGLKTRIEFQCGVYIDPASGDIYSVNNDTVDKLVIFSRQAKGDVPPDRFLETPHGTFGIAVDEEKEELFLTVQHDNAVVVYRKTASGKDAPIRLLQGGRTGLADPHGIAIDTKNRLMFVANHGSVHSKMADPRLEGISSLQIKANWPLNEGAPGSGRILPPSITVYPLDASGDAIPLRVIQGPKAQLNWPAGLAVDPERGELYVANDMSDAVLVFRETDGGDAAPLRALRGPKTGIKNPTGVFLDKKNGELWIASFGNHTLTVYPPTAQGDTAPLRAIRSAPSEAPSLMIGNPGAVAYDQKREEILVPN